MATTTADSTVCKILVAADVAGHHDSLFDAVRKAMNGKAGPFSILLCVGKFFGNSEESDNELKCYIDGSKTVPLPTYFIHGDELISRNTNLLQDIEDGGDLCPNLTYLGGVGKRQINGLSVCYLSGSFDERIYSSAPKPMAITKGRYNEEMIEELLICGNAYRRDIGVDILMTSEFGEGFDNLLDPEKRPSCQLLSLQSEGTPEQSVGSLPKMIAVSPAVGRLGKELSPRYHFAGSGAEAFVLPPYRNNIGVCRLYGMEPPSASGKVKVKAFGVTTTVPTEEDLEMTRKAATENPYTSKRFVPDKFLTVASRSADQVESSTTLAPMEPPPPVGDMDEMHTQLPSGDWKCGYCDNMNRARYKQTERCNMKFCMAPRYLGPNETGGSLSAAAAKVLQLQLAEAAEARKRQAEEATRVAKELAKKQLEGEDGEGKGKKKRESIYADQGGGLSNPKKNRYKKGRPGDPSGPSHSRVKW